MDKEELGRLLSARYDKRSVIQPSSLPEIELYMDQVTTFMEDKLKRQRRYPEDKILTKTMINNYTKNHLLPPPNKKKYSQDHLLTLIYTYYLKNMLSINDIHTLLQPMIDNYWGKGTKESSEEDSGLTMKDIYAKILSVEPKIGTESRKTVRDMIHLSENLFAEDQLSEDEKDYLQQLTLCLLLAFDIYMKKQMLEELIDQMPDRS